MGNINYSPLAEVVDILYVIILESFGEFTSGYS
jgi:hypothetical protein